MHSFNKSNNGNKPSSSGDADTLREVLKFLYDIEYPQLPQPGQSYAQSRARCPLQSQMKAVSASTSSASSNRHFLQVQQAPPETQVSQQALEEMTFQRYYEYYTHNPHSEHLDATANRQPYLHSTFRATPPPSLPTPTETLPAECLNLCRPLSQDEFDNNKFNSMIPMMMNAQGRTPRFSPASQAMAYPTSTTLSNYPTYTPRDMQLTLPQLAAPPQPHQPQQPRIMVLTPEAINELERIRAIRQDNLMKLWAVHSIVNAKPDLLVEYEPAGAACASADPIGQSLAAMWQHPKHSRAYTQPKRVCTFCRKNGEPAIVYESHWLKNTKGQLTCPILQRHICEICGATGMQAHTMRHCPYNVHQYDDDLPAFRLLANGAISSSHNHK